MSELTRRAMLSGAAAAAAIAPLAAPWAAFAAAPPAGTQAPGCYRYKVGNFEITVVTDGVNRFKLPDDFVSNVKKEEVNAALRGRPHGAGHFHRRRTIRSSSTPGRSSSLIDTGTGEAAFQSTKGTSGQLHDQSRRPPASTPSRSIPSSSRTITATT